MSSFNGIEDFFSEDGGLDVYRPSKHAEKKAIIKIPSNAVDWAAVIGQIIKTSGATYDDLAEITGFGSSYLRAVHAESVPCETADKAVRLLGVYLKNVDKTIPKMGDDNEI